MIDSTIVQNTATSAINAINAITGLIVAITTAAAYIWGRSRGFKKAIREGLKNEGTAGAGHKK